MLFCARKILTGRRVMWLAVLVMPFTATAQRSGLIYQTAGTGAAVLDPDGNGYTSLTTAGFSSSDYTESEIQYQPIPQVQTEPNSDLATGPDCGFTDFVDDGGEYSAGAYFDGTNFLFRFRLAGTANNSKGYSILIDADQKMGAYGEHQDPNYTTGNPGFEIEVVLQTNFGVYLYDVDGSATPTQKGSPYAYTDYCQKSIAENLSGTITCGSKYFYDFYIPFSAITTYFPTVTSSTPLRFVANTLIAPKSVLQGPISDIQGVEDNDYGSADLAWTAAIENIYPKSVTDVNSGFTDDRTTNVPTLESPISVGATSASVTVAAGGVIKVYKEGTSLPVCSTTVGASGTHLVTGCTSFASGDRVYATLTETGKSESASSNVVQVNSCTLTVSTSLSAPVTAQNEKKLVGTNTSGATVKIYNNGTFYANATVSTTSWEYSFGTSGNGLIPCGTWQATQTETGKCESALSEPYCQTVSQGGGSACATTYTQTATPTITTPVYNTDKVITGTTTSGATVYLYVNNVYMKSVTASGTAWTASGLTLSTSDVISVRALGTGGGLCRSNAVTAAVVQGQSIAPVVNGPIVAGATTIYGSSIEPAGTTITVSVNGSSIGTTTVSSDGTWSKSTTALSSGNTVNATATASGKTESSTSNTVTVSAGAETVTPTITGTYSAGGTSVSGTLPSGILTGTTYTIVLYEDGMAIDTFTTFTNGSTVNPTPWTSNTLHTTAVYWDYLYTGGELTATAYRSGSSSEGSVSNAVTVGCSSPSNKSFSATSSYLQSTGTASIEITSSESGVVYTLTNSDGTSLLGNSKVGTGGTITLTSNSLSVTTTLYVKAEKIEAGACSVMLSGSSTITVDAEAVYTNNTTNHPGAYTNGETLATVSDADGAGSAVVSASVTSGSLPPGTTLNSSTGAITISSLASIVAGTYNFTITTTDASAGNIGSTAAPLEMTFPATPLPVELISFSARPEGRQVNLDWVTASEINNSHFEVQRSADGDLWQQIGRVSGHGNSHVLQSYTFVDHAAGSIGLKTIYYRLRQVDYNGDFEYSVIRPVRLGESFEIQSYPNPVNRMLTVTMELSETGATIMQIIDVNGSVIYEEAATGTGAMRKQVDMQHYPSGMYFLKIISSSGSSSKIIHKN